MDLKLGGKVALVGGGSRGLGRATAEMLSQEGASVCIYARRAEKLTRAACEIEAVSGGRVYPVRADVRNASDCNRAIAEVVARLGRLDILVTNMASDTYKSDLLGENDETWRAEFELYTLSVIRLCRAAVPHMRAAGGGSIVNLISYGVHQIIPELALSEVARLATAGFAKYLATELAPDGIRVNNVDPGWIAGERVDELFADESTASGESAEEIYQRTAAAIPMRRFGSNDDVAAAIAFLASDRAAYITGTNLRVDGGCTLGPLA